MAPIAPCADLVAAAEASHVPLEGIDPPREGSVVGPGDAVTALVTLCQGGMRRTQWLVRLEGVTPGAKELAARPPPPRTLYTSVGGRHEYSYTPAFVSLRTIGPFDAADHPPKPAKPHEKNARTALNRDFLALGADRAAVASFRIHNANANAPKGWFEVRGTPYTAAETNAGWKLAETVGLTDAEERTLCGSAPALDSYFGIVEQTPGLDEILFKVLDRSLIWSVILHAGVSSVHFRFLPDEISVAAATQWGLPDGTPAYQLPIMIEINHRPTLKLTLVVTRPKPPFLACAGVVGLLAERPGDPETYLTLRVLSARAALAATEKAEPLRTGQAATPTAPSR